MKRKLTTTDALEAFRLARLGSTLDTILLNFRQRGVVCSRQTIWRAVQEVSTAQERIALARATGNFDLVSVGEALAAVETEPNQSSLKELVQNVAPSTGH